MSTNKDLLKQAIAEAKTIRETAIANAKEALEESITPHLREMLAMKLQEMDQEGEDEMPTNPEDYTKQPGYVHEAEDDETPEEDENEPTEEEGEENKESEEDDEDLDFENMSREEFTDLVLQIVHEDEPKTDDMTDDSEIDITELLRELEEGVDEYTAPARDRGTSYGKDSDTSLGQDVANAVKLTGAQIAAVAKKLGTTAEAIYDAMGSITGGYYSGRKGVQKEGVDEYTAPARDRGTSSGADSDTSLGQDVANAVKLTGAQIQKIAKKLGVTAEKVYDAMGSITGGHFTTPSSQGPDTTSEAELNEALKTVQILRSQLQEVNLLNAKLLYVNKVFKANNLTEGQKVNVVTAFDKAETVREVKLVFETVSKNVVANQPARPAIKEHKSFASKPAGSTQKQVINEVSEAVNRMQILAGIKQREF
jgi:transposase